MIHHTVDHAADFTLSNSPQVTHSVHSLCQHIMFTVIFSQLFLSHCLDGPGHHYFIGSMIMSSWPATPSTIDDRLPSCLTVNRFQTFKATMTVSLFMIHVTVRNHRPVILSLRCCTRHSAPATNFRFISIHITSFHNSISSTACRNHNHFTSTW